MTDSIPALIAAGFSPEAYRSQHRDLATLNDQQAAHHFLECGVGEARHVPISELNIEALTKLDPVVISALARSYGAYLPEKTNLDIATVIDLFAFLREFGCRPYLIMGDVHSNLYRRSDARGQRWLAPTHLSCTPGTAIDLADPNSPRGYGRRVQDLILRIRHDIPVLLCFGQIDAEFVTLFRQLRAGRSSFSMIEAMKFVRQSTKAYIDFLKTAVPMARRDSVYVLSILPPGLSDDIWASGEVDADIAREEAADIADLENRVREFGAPNIRERSRLHEYYNQLLQERTRETGFGFIDAASAVSTRFGMLDPRYVRKHKRHKHSLDFLATKSPLTGLIWQHVDPNGANAL